MLFKKMLIKKQAPYFYFDDKTIFKFLALIPKQIKYTQKV